MKWIEIITLRSSNKVHESLVSELLKHPVENDGNNRLISMDTYRNAWINTDMSVHLHWKSTSTGQLGSAMGLRLARALKEYGLVNHSVWVEERKEG